MTSSVSVFTDISWQTVSIFFQVVIKYVPYVGDSKRAMDEYTSEIMMGGINTIALHNTCEVSLFLLTASETKRFHQIWIVQQMKLLTPLHKNITLILFMFMSIIFSTNSVHLGSFLLVIKNL